MKILLSPSKTQLNPALASNLKFIPINHQTYFSPKQVETTELILRTLLSSDYKKYYEGFEQHDGLAAIQSYTGLVFKQLELSQYNKSAFNYLDQHLVILSALYGMTAAFDQIKPHRLDFHMKIGNLNLYRLWSDYIQAMLINEDFIVNLASNEFSKMVNLPKITIHFREYDHGKFVNKATYSKMARGKMLHIMIVDNIDTIEAIKTIAFDDYAFNASISDPHNFYYTRIAIIK